jgi:exonuclease III
MRPPELCPEATVPASDRTDRQIAEAITRRGFLDAALHQNDKTGDETLLARTASDDRTDQILVSAALADALLRYQLLDTPSAASDHHGVLAEFDTDLIKQDLMWAYQYVR